MPYVDYRTSIVMKPLGNLEPKLNSQLISFPPGTTAYQRYITSAGKAEQ